jgi:hypothetical protein
MTEHPGHRRPWIEYIEKLIAAREAFERLASDWRDPGVDALNE